MAFEIFTRRMGALCVGVYVSNYYRELYIKSNKTLRYILSNVSTKLPPIFTYTINIRVYKGLKQP